MDVRPNGADRVRPPTRSRASNSVVSTPALWSLCAAESPEGQSVGVVKNISLSAIVSISSSLLPVMKELNKFDIMF